MIFRLEIKFLSGTEEEKTKESMVSLKNYGKDHLLSVQLEETMLSFYKSLMEMKCLAVLSMERH